MSSPKLRRRESGQVLALSVMVTSVLMAFALTIGTAVHSANGETANRKDRAQQLVIAEAGLNATLHNLRSGNPLGMGSEENPIVIGGENFWSTLVDNRDGTYTITSRASFGEGGRALRALFRETGHVFHHALFAANSSQDPLYVMDVGGEGDQADEIRGDLYSGNDILFWGDASVTGTARAQGSITGRDGSEEGVTMPGFDFSGMNYEALADVSVADEFAANRMYHNNAAGGVAYQVPESNGAHIFRLNPNDRRTEYRGTVKDDYFLEDPYERVGRDVGQNGRDPYYISTTSDGSLSGHRCIYYIDGNLWIHNNPSYSFGIRSVGSDGTQITFVVKGNIYFSDNVFLENPEKDGVAFIALKDDSVADSGNIYFGDPRGGTLEYMAAFMCAENDFVENNISARGSTLVEVHGTMAAGNHVAITRNFNTHHSKLVVGLDERVKRGTLTLPGIPTQTQSISYELVAWLEISPTMP